VVFKKVQGYSSTKELQKKSQKRFLRLTFTSSLKKTATLTVRWTSQKTWRFKLPEFGHRGFRGWNLEKPQKGSNSQLHTACELLARAPRGPPLSNGVGRGQWNPHQILYKKTCFKLHAENLRKWWKEFNLNSVCTPILYAKMHHKSVTKIMHHQPALVSNQGVSRGWIRPKLQNMGPQSWRRPLQWQTNQKNAI